MAGECHDGNVLHYLAEQPLLLVFVLIGVGMALGSFKVRGISLGAAAVLFLGIAFSAVVSGVSVPPLVGTLGLVLFAFGIGNNSGVTFFKSLRTATAPVLSMIGVFAAAAVVAWGLGIYAFHLDIAMVSGAFAGAITNTPALAAATEATGDDAQATVGYAVAYLFGVVGMMVATVLVLRGAGNDDDTAVPVVQVNLQVTRKGGMSVAEVVDIGGNSVQVTRLRRVGSNDVELPGMFDILFPGDVITLVGEPTHLEAVLKTAGRESPQALTEDRHDLDFRRITISQHQLAGHTIDDLNRELTSRWGARISRVRRADHDRVAVPEFVVELGDRVRVVAPVEHMREISEYLGDSSQGLTDINPVSLGLGLAAGMYVGHLAIPLPGGFSLSLGAAAGVLIVALVMGRIGRVGSLITALPHSANTVLAELGLLLFLAQAGTNAGGQILGAFESDAWWKLLLLGAVITTIVAAGLTIVMRRVLHIGATKTAGILGGAQTQPAILAFANNRTHTDQRVELGYAMVYPAAMIAKILITHVLALMG